MAYLTLNCPQCRKWLVYVPLDGLTLHYRCAEHGLLILRPLMVESEDHSGAGMTHMHSSDAA